MTKTLDLFDVCEIAKTIVMYMPEDYNCQRLNSFAWISELNELNTENILATEKSIDEGEAWFRHVAETKDYSKIYTQYPVLAMDSVKGMIKKFCTPEQYEETEITFWALDKYVANAEKDNESCDDCMYRSKKRVEHDMRKAIDYFINQFTQFGLLYDVANQRYIWTNIEERPAIYADQRLFTDCCVRISNKIVTNSVDIGPVNGGAHNLLGCFVTLSIKESFACKVDHKPDYSVDPVC